MRRTSSRSGCSATARSARAFAALLDERADEIERFNGRRPVLSGVLTRSRGDFEEILAGSDLIVEVMGGIEPAREYLLRAMRAGSTSSRANKQLLSQHGEELFEAAREHDVRLRFEAAVAGVVPVVRVLEESLVGDADRAHPRDRQRHDELHPHRDERAARATRRRSPRPSGAATPRPTRRDDVTGRDAAAKMAILARLAFGTPVHLDEVPLRGHRAHAERRPRSTRASSASA